MTSRRTFEPDGRAIPYLDEGAGPALVLLPGMGLDPTYLGTLASVLVEEDFRVVQVGSRRPSGDPVSLSDLARDVVDVMDHVGLEDAWIGGHAFGGEVARTVAAEHPDHTNGVLLLGVAGGGGATPEAADAWSAILTGATGINGEAAVRELAGPNADVQRAGNFLERSRDAEVVAHQRAAADGVVEGSLAPHVPVLVIQGAEDRFTPPSAGEQLRASAPHLVTVVTLDGMGHLFPLTHPGETAAVIEDYLDWD